MRENGATVMGGQVAANGTVFTPQITISVRWAYMAMLAIQLALASVILALTVAMTRCDGIQPLKDSSIATICSVDPATRAALGSMDDFTGTKRTAAKTDVRLKRNRSGLAVNLSQACKITATLDVEANSTKVDDAVTGSEFVVEAKA
jgi:hypothetical protein